MKFSICIPSFNRPDKLHSLILSIQSQDYQNYEVIICEDNSPKKKEIERLINTIDDQRIKFYANKVNLGYDANLRKTIELATGDYVILMGNDDLFNPNVFSIILKKINKFKPSIIVRSYETFYKTEDKYFQMHRYVRNDHLIKPFEEDFAWLFYRVVLVSGLVFKRNLALKFHSNVVDGTLYYQNYLLCNIAKTNKVLYIPELLVKNRLEDAGDFGTSNIESRGAWTPGKRTIDSSIYQMKKFFECAEITSEHINVDFVNKLKKISSAYSYSLLSYHSNAGFLDFLSYANSLRLLGYSGPYFYLYVFLLKIFGKKICDFLIKKIKVIFGFTVRLI